MRVEKEIQTMNRTNKYILWIWLILIVLMGLFPPVAVEFKKGYLRRLGYRFLPLANGPIATSNLILQWTIVSVIAGGLIITFKDKKTKSSEWCGYKEILNKKQKICLWVGITIIVLMGLFPPWVVKQVFQKGNWNTITLRKYIFIFKAPYIHYKAISPPHPKAPKDIVESYKSIRAGFNHVEQIDVTRLLIQWFIIALITGGLIVTFKDKKPKDEKDNK